MDTESWYGTGAVITGLIAYFAIWIYALYEWGILVGLAIGWFPAMIGAVIIGAIWPLIVLALAGIILLTFYAN